MPYFMANEVNYDVGLALLHYCRLLHKANKKIIKSPKLSQFLLNLSYGLTKCNISSTQAFNEQRNKLRQVLQEYYNKFVLEHEDKKVIISPREIIIEIENMKKNQRFVQTINVLDILLEESKILNFALDNHNLDVFLKNSQSKSIIENNKLGL